MNATYPETVATTTAQKSLSQDPPPTQTRKFSQITSEYGQLGTRADTAHRTLEQEKNRRHVSILASQSNHWAASDRK